MKTIYKYGIPIQDDFTIEMPKGAKILCVRVQNQSPFIWAEVNTVNTTVPRSFKTYGTGHEIEDGIRPAMYLGTYQFNGGVWHVYEVLLNPANS